MSLIHSTCPHIRLVALLAGTGFILAEHAHIVGLSTLQVRQIAVGHGVVTLSLVTSVCCDAHCHIGRCPTGSLPRHCGRVRAAAQSSLHVGGCARHWGREEARRMMKVLDEVLPAVHV